MGKVLYFDPIGGVSGDMFTAAFLDADMVTLKELQETVDKVIPKVGLFTERDFRCGIEGTRLRVVSAEGEEKPGDGHLIRVRQNPHEHYPYQDIRKTIESSSIDGDVKQLALSIFEVLARAEAKIHGTKIEDIVFHEVGRNDAIADIVCAAYCVKKLGAVKIICGPIPLGQGTITFSHGTMPVPAPATLEILRGIPTVPGYPIGEMTTPTGAAIIVACCREFRSWTNLTADLIGYGHGTRNPQGYPASFRIILGKDFNKTENALDYDEIMELSTNIDDQSPQVLAPVMDKLIKEGAVDVFVMPYSGKKSRQGQAWTVLAKSEDAQRISIMMMQELGTIGIRMARKERYKLKREPVSIMFNGETIRAKRVFGPGINHVYPEIDDLIKMAEKKGVPLRVLKNMIDAGRDTV